MGRVLVVDDETMFQEFVREELGRLGHETVGAVTGMEAVEKAREKAPDLILLDLQMPQMDGVDTLRRLRAANVHAPVILLTVRRNHEALAHAEALGVEQILFKPVDLIQLFMSLEEKLARMFPR